MQIYAATCQCFKSVCLSLHTSYVQRGLMCHKIGGKLKNRFGQHELSLISYSVLFAPSVRKSQTELSLACTEFIFARVELSPVCFSGLICVELTQVRVSSKFYTELPWWWGTILQRPLQLLKGDHVSVPQIFNVALGNWCPEFLPVSFNSRR